MNKILFLFIFLGLFTATRSQSRSVKITKAFQQFVNDSQLRHATCSFYVINAKTGQVVFDRNSRIGLAGASTQKVITATTAFELLGKDYRYHTELGYTGAIQNQTLNGNIYLIGSGDPTLGSWRWEETRDSNVLMRLSQAIKKLKISRITGSVITNTSKFSHQAIPDGWIWQDIGNYYGAGAYPLNWKENQFELMLRSENKLGGKVIVLGTDSSSGYINELKASGKESGDNAYLYFDHSLGGTIPLGEKQFSISGAMRDPVNELLMDMNSWLSKDSITSEARYGGYARSHFRSDSAELSLIKNIYTNYSPSLDSIIYWFLKKSINLYGEALIKTFALEKKGYANTAGGIAIVKDFWRQKGIDEDELNIYDGSGLSPLNRITTHAQVEVLKLAKTRDWFPYFYDALPEYNGMKMKSGTINDVKGFCGYQTSKDGQDFIFSILVNNYAGSTSGLVNKIFRVLDELK